MFGVWQTTRLATIFSIDSFIDSLILVNHSYMHNPRTTLLSLYFTYYESTVLDQSSLKACWL